MARLRKMIAENKPEPTTTTTTTKTPASNTPNTGDAIYRSKLEVRVIVVGVWLWGAISNVGD